MRQTWGVSKIPSDNSRPRLVATGPVHLDNLPGPPGSTRKPPTVGRIVGDVGNFLATSRSSVIILSSMRKLQTLILLGLLVASTTSLAWFPRLAGEMGFTAETTIIGRNLDYVVGPGETLIELARRAGIGYDNLVRANPGIDPWNPSPGTRLILPKSALPVADMAPGITINLAELRLFLIWEEGTERKVRIYPVGIGREGWESPLGEFQVSVVIENPSWTPPASLRLNKPGLPGVVAPGPDNPLGSHWIGLTAQGVGIHGTNQPLGVGRRISHGCIRLYPEDILDLARRVSPGIPVRIIDHPVKHLIRNDTLHLEVHRPIDEVLLLEGPNQAWSGERLVRVLREARGIPLAIPRDRP